MEGGIISEFSWARANLLLICFSGLGHCLVESICAAFFSSALNKIHPTGHPRPAFDTEQSSFFHLCLLDTLAQLMAPSIPLWCTSRHNLHWWLLEGWYYAAVEEFFTQAACNINPFMIITNINIALIAKNNICPVLVRKVLVELGPVHVLLLMVLGEKRNPLYNPSMVIFFHQNIANAQNTELWVELIGNLQKGNAANFKWISDYKAFVGVCNLPWAARMWKVFCGMVSLILFPEVQCCHILETSKLSCLGHCFTSKNSSDKTILLWSIMLILSSLWKWHESSRSMVLQSVIGGNKICSLFWGQC